MTTHALLILILLGAPAVAFPQVPAVSQATATIESADVVGIDRDRLSDALRRDIAALNGAPMDRDRLAALAARIDAEQPEFAAAVRDVPQPDGRVRIVFVVMRIGEDATLAANVNARYTVERAEIDGIEEERISRALRDEVQALVGRPVAEVEVKSLVSRLEAELPEHEVNYRVSRGDESGRVRVVFAIRRTEASWWMPFAQNGSKLVYHHDLGWSGVFDIPFGTRSNRFTLGFVAGNNDDLVEEYSGYSFRFENREAGSRRLGLSFELARYTQDWNEATLAALALNSDAARPYDRRLTAIPTVTVALTRYLRVTGGIAASELEPLTVSDLVDDSEVPLSLKDTRVTSTLAGVAFDRTWRGDSALTQRLIAGYNWEAGTASLDSDLVYDRHAGTVRYTVSGRDSSLLAVVRAGRITGDAPLFARFTLGDSQTLRGWDKYAIAPTGADRMVYSSVEYHYKHFLYFLDGGSLWQPGEDRQLRLSTGVGVNVGGSFISVGVPLNADSVSGKVILGIRASVTFDAAWLR